MKPAKRDLLIIQGATYRRVLRAPGIDLTGVQARMKGRDEIGKDPIRFELTGGAGLTITPGATESQVVIQLYKATTAQLARDGVYDLFFDYADGSSQMVLFGRYLLHRRV